MKYKNLSNSELIEKLKEIDYYDSELCALICDRAGLAAQWAREEVIDFGDDIHSVLWLAIKKLTGC